MVIHLGKDGNRSLGGVGRRIILFSRFSSLSYCEMMVTKIWILDCAKESKTLGTFLACSLGSFSGTASPLLKLCWWSERLRQGVLWTLGRLGEGAVGEEGVRITQETPRSSGASSTPTYTPLPELTQPTDDSWEESQAQPSF